MLRVDRVQGVHLVGRLRRQAVLDRPPGRLVSRGKAGPFRLPPPPLPLVRRPEARNELHDVLTLKLQLPPRQVEHQAVPLRLHRDLRFSPAAEIDQVGAAGPSRQDDSQYPHDPDGPSASLRPSRIHALCSPVFAVLFDPSAARNLEWMMLIAVGSPGNATRAPPILSRCSNGRILGVAAVKDPQESAEVANPVSPGSSGLRNYSSMRLT